ncbi:hypothetical protein SynMVIR181_02896 [Synechococcus sp. MVIR-18-1]|nr:hypothetical protein SynMVIR181_02896 [Synechococcus sp. MVIR-18-1]
MLGVSFPPMNTPSFESTAEVMSWIKRCCDLGHRFSQALKKLRSWRSLVSI